MQSREELNKKNIVLRCNSGWLGISKSTLDSYISSFGHNFNIILLGKEDSKGDYFVIPYDFLKEFLIEKNLATPGKLRRLRWLGWIRGQKLKVGNNGTWCDISQFYGVSLDIITDSEKTPDFSSKDVKREIFVRRHQEKFRADVLNNFDSQCCLTNTIESDLLQACHIISWSEDEEKRLDPSNGLCLSIGYHKLFDQGYFSFDDQLNVIVTDKIETLSEETRRQLQAIRGKRLRAPSNYPINTQAIAKHRKEVFEQKFSL